jgi:hypothetical protein
MIITPEVVSAIPSVNDATFVSAVSVLHTSLAGLAVTLRPTTAIVLRAA